jgi:murein DD-endopeptidase MepM/ murein hydrolase activator NlpD
MHSGVVTVLSAPASYGRYATVEADWGLTLYAHLSRALRDGEHVQAGELIGYSGNTGGTSTGPHLHIGVKPKPVDQGNGYKGWVDPLPLLQEGERMEAIRKAATGVRWEIEEIERLLIEAEQHDNTVIAERAMAERCRRQARQKLQALISTKNGNAYRVEGLLGGALPRDWEGLM